MKKIAVILFLSIFLISCGGTKNLQGKFSTSSPTSTTVTSTPETSTVDSVYYSSMNTKELVNAAEKEKDNSKKYMEEAKKAEKAASTAVKSKNSLALAKNQEKAAAAAANALKAANAAEKILEEVKSDYEETQENYTNAGVELARLADLLDEANDAYNEALDANGYKNIEAIYSNLSYGFEYQYENLKSQSGEIIEVDGIDDIFNYFSDGVKMFTDCEKSYTESSDRIKCVYNHINSNDLIDELEGILDRIESADIFNTMADPISSTKNDILEPMRHLVKIYKLYKSYNDAVSQYEAYESGEYASLVTELEQTTASLESTITFEATAQAYYQEAASYSEKAAGYSI